jgi:hypothetical protein
VTHLRKTPTTSNDAAARTQMSRALKLSDAARQYPAFSKFRLRQLIASGELPARWCGGLLILMSGDVEAYLASLPPVVPSRRAAPPPAATQKARRL